MREERSGYADIKGAKRKVVPNPLSKSKWGNLACICGSFKKVKKCCGKLRWVDPNRARAAQEYVKRFGHMSAQEIISMQVGWLAQQSKVEDQDAKPIK